MSKRTMRKRLARAYDLSPKEARYMLRRCGYDYELTVYMLMLDRSGIKIEDTAKAFEKLGKVTVEVTAALCDTFERIGEAFSKAFLDTAESAVDAAKEVISEVLDI